MTHTITLRLLDKELTIHHFPANHPVPSEVLEADFYSISKTSVELSVVCDSSLVLPSGKAMAGWACIAVLGPLEFSLTGILSGISTVLAQAHISLFAISTFDTDYILVQSQNTSKAIQSLSDNGYVFE